MFSCEGLRRLAAVVLVLGTLSAHAVELDDEDDDDDEGDAVALGSVEADVDEPTQRLGGWLELRPSYSLGDQGVHAENETALTWALTDNATIGYTQEWAAGIFRSLEADGDPVVPSGLGDGYLWTEFADLWTASRGNVRFSYEPRLYLPTATQERNAGLVAATRQMLKLDVRVGPSVELFFREIPIVAYYTKSGYANDDGSFANRYFENRFELGARATFWNERVTASMKVVLQSLRYTNFEEEAENNDRWSHLLHIEPEITVKVAPKTTLGVAYYSDSLVTESFGASQLGEGLKRGVLQMVLGQEI